MIPLPTDADRRPLAAHGRRLEYFTIAWNSAEGLVAIVAGATAGSISLVGFGVDSIIEVASGAAVLWRMSVDANACQRARSERLSLRLVGWCFLLLATYVAYEAVADLASQTPAAHSLAGILLACASLVVMPLLSRAKRRVGTSLQSAAMHADARQTEFCTYLSAILLGGLLLNTLWGLWWADPIAALVMVPIITKEGVAGIRGHACCAE
jgi:divalent metal cation (Fe/Co/Zn/Cd) transporter